MKKILLIVSILCFITILTGCDEIDLDNLDISGLTEEDINKIIVCNSPYMRFEAGCCLDQNTNSICDEHEGIQTEEEQEQPIEQETLVEIEEETPVETETEEPEECQDTNTDIDNCGECGNRCDFSHAIEACTSGVCVMYECEENYEDCDLNPTNGCETNLNTDTNNCGGCSNTCSEGNTCTSGVCTLDECEDNYADCDLNPTNGCETNLNTDTNHCGSCFMYCQPDTEICTEGVCVPTNCEIEICDNLDNDCDGLIDEDFPEVYTPCSTGAGECMRMDMYVCSEAGTLICNAVPGEPSEEICDGLDNDCDKVVDNLDTYTSCPMQEGVCTGAEQECLNGELTDCDYLNYNKYYEEDEISCDSLDNDCDGTTDEGCDAECYLDSECNDINDCTEDTCVGGGCVHKCLEGKECYDNNPFTFGETCQSGKGTCYCD